MLVVVIFCMLEYVNRLKTKFVSLLSGARTVYL